jgi:hypothetical protein
MCAAAGGTDGRRRRGGSRWLALGLAATVFAMPAAARAFGSYGSKLETGSAIALLAFGGVVFVPTAFALMDPPLTTQRIVGRSLVMAGSLVAIAFGVYYFASDDPLWVPHALGWGIGGGMVATGFIVWLTDDEGEATEEGAPEASDAGAPASGAEPPAVPVEPASGTAAGMLGLAPLAFPGGAGLLVAGVW